jgi:DNA-binding response OmpR family regulator
MSLRSLLFSSDPKTIRVVRRILSDLEIDLEHCPAAESAIRKITRNRFEAIIVDCSDQAASESVLKSAKASPTNARAVAIVLVDSALGLRGGFEVGGHFVLHKPLHPERARSSFRAVRALMKQERRRQTRIPVQIAVDCMGSRSQRKFEVRTIDLCEGGMAVRISGRLINESPVHFKWQLPGTNQRIEAEGEFAWESIGEIAGIRFISVSDEDRFLLREWIQNQLPDPQVDEPPVPGRIVDLTLGACYLETESPFPVSTRVALSLASWDFHFQATGFVRVMHPEFGMGVEFEPGQQEHISRLIETLRRHGESSSELLVCPELLEASSDQGSGRTSFDFSSDSLVELFRHKSEVPLEAFLAEMRQQRRAAETA